LSFISIGHCYERGRWQLCMPERIQLDTSYSGDAFARPDRPERAIKMKQTQRALSKKVNGTSMCHQSSGAVQVRVARKRTTIAYAVMATIAPLGLLASPQASHAEGSRAADESSARGALYSSQVAQALNALTPTELVPVQSLLSAPVEPAVSSLTPAQVIAAGPASAAVNPTGGNSIDALAQSDARLHHEITALDPRRMQAAGARLRFCRALLVAAEPGAKQ
jgi:hypothetical protein